MRKLSPHSYIAETFYMNFITQQPETKSYHAQYTYMLINQLLVENEQLDSFLEDACTVSDCQ